MKKLNKKEISFIQGVCENNLIQGYWLFSYYSQSNFENVKKYIEKKEEIDNKLSELDYLEHRISSNLTRDKKKIKKLFELQRVELINKLDKDWNEKKIIIFMNWIMVWKKIDSSSKKTRYFMKQRWLYMKWWSER